ncbi:hypothetical protein FE257_001771 [Aspergillus nanangensis]|uniref:Uncharacterized protein n=1 Tax=Aspergillus nanangensis TaxID=2582783 RepID=A0AAD4GPG8_ASPNN|nr:hypothetical protein FE257_001771 [Aspergillus nanangensis]
MPIPTRSLSLREPRQQSTANIGRPTTAKTPLTATKNTTTAAAHRAPLNPTTSNENISNRPKSLLPVRDDVRSTSSSRVQQSQDRRLPQRGLKPPTKGPTQQEQPVPKATTVGRRQSLVRPSPLKITSSTKPAIGSTALKDVSGPPSPSKSSTASKQNGRPLSPKKTDMGPPPRPVRSASLRQPASSSSGTPMSSRGHARHRSQVLTPASSQTTKKLEPPLPSPTTPRAKGQFSTYQQHYSPKKAAAPSVAPASTAASTNIDPSLVPSSWPEIAALQTELLQLGLLHTSSLQQHAEWEIGAQTRLGKLYDSVAKDYHEVLTEEKERQRQLNGQVLHYWLNNCREHHDRQVFAEQIQVFSRVAQEVCDLTDSLGGRYLSLVQAFDTWFQEAEEIKTMRHYQEDVLDDVVFIDPLDNGWKEEVYAMTMRLELCLRQLQSLDVLGYGEVEQLESSTLLRVVKALDEMINMMVDELQAVRKIEADVVRAERQWVSQLTQHLSGTRPSEEERVPRAGMWRQLSLKS